MLHLNERVKMAKVCAYFCSLVILLSLGSVLRPAHCLVEESVPESGSTLAGNEGEENITILCSVMREAGGPQRVTEWFIETEGQTSGPRLIINTDTNFVIVGEPIPNNTDFTFRTNFTMLRLTSDLDRAVIYCGLGGNPPTLAANFTLRIYRPPDLNSIVEQTATENDGVEIAVGVGVEVFPFPLQFQWTKDGVAVMNSSRISYGYTSVVFQSVQREDRGNYTLSATNFRLDDENQQVGSDTGSFFLNVFYGPDITLGPSVVATLEGDNATLVCGTNLTGNPEPTVQWMDNNNTEVRRNDSRFVFDDGPEIVSLSIFNVTVEDDGIWRCIVQVENASEVQQNVTLTAVVAPSEPRNVSIDSIGGTWAVISWLTPVFIGRPPITEYRITATSLLNRNTSTAVQNETNTLAVNVTGLLPATEYKFTVAAVSVVQATEIFIAESPQSIADNGTTLLTVPEAVCGAPTSEGGVITVTWSYIHTGGLDLTALAVDYRASDEAANFLELDNGNLTDLGQTRLQVLNFTAGRTYIFRVTASNGRGSTTVVCPSILHSVGIPQTPATPTGMSNSPGNVILTLSTAESGTEASTELFNFTVRAEQVTSDDVIVSLHLRPIENYTDTQAVEVAIGGLVGNQEYRFSAAASNRFGSSSFSENSQAIRVQESPVSPPVPTNVGAIVGGVIVAVLVIVLLIFIFLLLVCCCVIRPSKEKSPQYGEELVSNQVYVTHGKADPQTKQTEFQMYEAIGDSKKEVSTSNDSLYDSLAPHPQQTDNPLYSSMEGLEVEIQMQQNPPATPEKRKLPADKAALPYTGSTSEDRPKNNPMTLYSEAIPHDHSKNEPVYSEATEEPSEKQHSHQPQAAEHVYMDPGPAVVAPPAENIANGSGADLDDGSEGTTL